MMNTIYINNLNHKIKDSELKSKLRETFEKYGKILQIISCCVFHLRGQAWITFDKVEEATEALESMKEKELFGRPMHIQFSKNKSDLIAKRDGTYKPREKRETPSEQNGNKRRKIEENGPKSTAVPRPLKNMPPNHILIAEDLPQDCTKEQLEKIFSEFHGLSEIRLISSKRVAFIEFVNEGYATIALKNRNNHRMSESHLLFVNFAKK